MRMKRQNQTYNRQITTACIDFIEINEKNQNKLTLVGKVRNHS